MPPPTTNRAGAWLTGLTLLVLSYPVWTRGGTTLSLQLGQVWLALGLLAALITLPAALAAPTRRLASLKTQLIQFLHDPWFACGVAWLLLLSAQWWNAGRVPVLATDGQTWTYSAPRVAWMPSAFSRLEALEMLAWFFPAWVLVLSVRSGEVMPRHRRLLWLAMVVNAGAVALAGVLAMGKGPLQQLLSATSETGFATFGYANHAGAFFTLMFCVAAGLLAEQYRWRYRHGAAASWLDLALAATMLLTLVGANLALTRAGSLMSGLAAATMATFVIVQTWRRHPPAKALNLTAAIVALLCLGVFAVIGFGDAQLMAEWSTLNPLKLWSSGAGNRGELAAAAVRVWQQQPVWGTGGWGFRYLLPLNVTTEAWEGLALAGTANVHNDPLQYLSEFGVVGITLMVLGVMILVRDLPRSRVSAFPPGVMFSLCGLLLVALHGLIDLPFRCPAILNHWLVLLATLAGLGFPPVARNTRQSSPTAIESQHER